LAEEPFGIALRVAYPGSVDVQNMDGLIVDLKGVAIQTSDARGRLFS
jgi:hypothetical protein